MHELGKDVAMTAKDNGVHSKPNMKEFGWWWQKAYLDDMDMDIHEAILGFRMRFRKEPLQAIVWAQKKRNPSGSITYQCGKTLKYRRMWWCCSDTPNKHVDNVVVQ